MNAARGTPAALLGGSQHSGGLKGHLDPQNSQLHKRRGDTIKEGTNTTDPLHRGGFGISLVPQSYIKQREGQKDILLSPQGSCTSLGRGPAAWWCWCCFGRCSDAAGAQWGCRGWGYRYPELLHLHESSGGRVCPPRWGTHRAGPCLRMRRLGVLGWRLGAGAVTGGCTLLLRDERQMDYGAGGALAELI